MSNRPRPTANGVDLAMFQQRAAFEQLVGKYREVAARAQALGIPTELILLTARFEVLTAIVAQAMGVDPERVMLDVEEQAVGRAIDKLEPAIVELTAHREQITREGFLKSDGDGS